MNDRSIMNPFQNNRRDIKNVPTKPMNQILKLLERIIEVCLRQEYKISKKKFGLMPRGEQ